jgi:hypothetical protein
MGRRSKGKSSRDGPLLAQENRWREAAEPPLRQPASSRLRNPPGELNALEAGSPFTLPTPVPKNRTRSTLAHPLRQKHAPPVVLSPTLTARTYVVLRARERIGPDARRPHHSLRRDGCRRPMRTVTAATHTHTSSRDGPLLAQENRWREAQRAPTGYDRRARASA